MSIVEKVKTILTGAGASILREDNIGKRKLGYPVNHVRFGYYYAFAFDAETEKINELNNTFRLHEDILRHLITKATKKTAEQLAKEEALLRRILSDEAQEEAANSIEERRERREEAKPKAEEKVAEAPQTEGEQSTAVDEASLDKKLDEILTDTDKIV